MRPSSSAMAIRPMAVAWTTVDIRNSYAGDAPVQNDAGAKVEQAGLKALRFVAQSAIGCVSG